MKAIIIDDEIPSLALFKMVLGKLEEIEIVGEFTNPQRALEEAIRLSPDVLFVDIEMPNLNGIELAKQVRAVHEDIQIVFITAYSQYAINAFEVNAVHYLLKPISRDALDETIKRLLKNYNAARQSKPGGKNVRRICAFGGFKVYGEVEDEVIVWPTRKVQELMAYFACRRNAELEKWQLCDLLWPDSSPEKAEHSLHSAISRMKITLKESGFENIVLRHKGYYSVDFHDFTCDLWEFEDFLESNAAVHPDNLVSFEKTLMLYQGELFGAEDYLWAAELRTKWHDQYVNGVLKLARYYIEHNNDGQAEHYLLKLSEKCPDEESAAALLMDVYARSGNKEKIAGAYNKLADVLRTDFDTVPTASIQDQYRKLLGLS